MKKQTSLITLSLMLATPALAGGAGAPAPRATTPATCQSIAQIIMNDPQFSTLMTAVQAAGLSETLGSGQYTVFAPTNAAFAKLPSDQLATVLNDEDMLRGVLMYHVVPGKVSSRQVMGLKSIKTAQGANLTVSMMGNRAMVGGANVTRADVQACNGVVHVIDTVLMPPMMAAAPMPMPAAPMAPAPAPMTTAPAAPAAPTAPAAIDISRIPATPLSGATVSTGTTGMATDTSTSTATTTTTTDTAVTGTTSTDTATTTTDTAAATTDTTAADTATTDTTATDTAATGTATTDTTVAVEANTLYDVIVADDRFSTLRDLLSDAGLTEMLTSGEYTLFAPTNEAFAALPADTLAVLASNPDVLKQVLSYHIVQGRVTAEQLASGAPLNAVEGGALPLSMNGSMQMIGTAGVTDTVTTASNGTIYVINQVLMPPGLTLPTPTDTSTTGTTDTSGTAGTTTDTAAAATTDTTTSTTTTTPAPAAATPAPATPAPATAAAPSTDSTTLVTLIAGDPRFSTLAGLIQQAGLTEQLASGEYTIFAPTNEAFARLAPADLAALTGDPARLKQVLLYHVVPGRVTAEQLASGAPLNAAEGGALTLSMNGSTQMIGTATVGAPLTTASNGTVYVIDTVLLPPAP